MGTCASPSLRRVNATAPTRTLSLSLNSSKRQCPLKTCALKLALVYQLVLVFLAKHTVMALGWRETVVYRRRGADRLRGF